MKNKSYLTVYLVVLVLVILSVSGCDILNPSPPGTPTELPNLLFTQAAETIRAQIAHDLPTATITPTPRPAPWGGRRWACRGCSEFALRVRHGNDGRTLCPPGSSADKQGRQRRRV